MLSFRVDLDVDSEEGAMLLARLLQDHDPDVLLKEITKKSEYRELKIKKWRMAQKAD